MGIVQDLMAKLRSGGVDADDAAVTLGLLIERDHVHRPLGDNGADELLRPESAAPKLSSDEINEAVSALTAYVRDAPEPRVSAIWALGKSANPATVPALIEVFERTVRDPRKEDLTLEVLQALIVNGIDSPFAPAAAAAIQRAAIEGRGEVKRLGAQYLQTLGPQTTTDPDRTGPSDDLVPGDSRQQRQIIGDIAVDAVPAPFMDAIASLRVHRSSRIRFLPGIRMRRPVLAPRYPM